MQTFTVLCTNAFGVQVKCLPLDGELMPQLNGVAERFVRTLVEAARAMCYGAICQQGG